MKKPLGSCVRCRATKKSCVRREDDAACERCLRLGELCEEAARGKRGRPSLDIHSPNGSEAGERQEHGEHAIGPVEPLVGDDERTECAILLATRVRSVLAKEPEVALGACGIVLESELFFVVLTAGRLGQSIAVHVQDSKIIFASPRFLAEVVPWTTRDRVISRSPLNGFVWGPGPCAMTEEAHRVRMRGVRGVRSWRSNCFFASSQNAEKTCFSMKQTVAFAKGEPKFMVVEVQAKEKDDAQEFQDFLEMHDGDYSVYSGTFFEEGPDFFL